VKLGISKQFEITLIELYLIDRLNSMVLRMLGGTQDPMANTFSPHRTEFVCLVWHN